ncbi:MAG: 16S rRNA processing protein RimM, partial [Firmicutes bacterium]|nr:16S rRNA processing protein RimM [Bacillota bacterium]
MKAGRRADPWQNPPPGLIAVGEVLTTQGNKGEVKVSPLTDTLERWLELTRVFRVSGTCTNELWIENIRFMRGLGIVKFRGGDSISAAEELRDEFLWRPEEERPHLPEGRFYLDEVIGVKVYGPNDCFLGTIAEVLQSGANDVY